tara:strand:- start:171117 stop:171341 length:225 start_codon:yes stop_codon:yes gene_type:complete
MRAPTPAAGISAKYRGDIMVLTMKNTWCALFFGIGIVIAHAPEGRQGLVYNRTNLFHCQFAYTVDSMPDHILAR